MDDLKDQPAPAVSPYLAGLACRCPRCGRGKLFAGFLTLRPNCEACGLDYAFTDVGDGAAIFVIMISGAIVVTSALIVEVKYQPSFWLHAGLWLPLAAARVQVAADCAAVPSQGRAGPADRPRTEMIGPR
jgi:uncharacterized protein (DUF983 family)